MVDVEAVGRAIRLAADTELVPRFSSLVDGEIEEKSPGEVVTVADRACEVLLSSLLRDIDGAPVVGEEGTAMDPDRLRLLHGDVAWLVDPLDGTSNFVAGSADYAVMVAYLERGSTVASWIWQPVHEVLAVASRGDGAFINGHRVNRSDAPELRECCGIVKTRFLPDPEKRQAVKLADAVKELLPGRNCAGVEYPDLISGKVDFLYYWRTLPWDHAPGALLAQEAGLAAVRPNGDRYSANDQRDGLLVAPGAVLDELEARLRPAS